MTEETTFIYGLMCPVDGLIHYVGKSDDPVNRMATHVRDMKRNRTLANDAGVSLTISREIWLDEIDRRGQSPALVILEQPAKSGYRQGTPHPAELRWIERLRADGHPLTNREGQPTGPSVKDKQLQEAIERGEQMFGRDGK